MYSRTRLSNRSVRALLSIVATIVAVCGLGHAQPAPTFDVNQKLAGFDLDITGCELRVVRSFRTRHDFAFHRDDKLAAKILRF